MTGIFRPPTDRSGSAPVAVFYLGIGREGERGGHGGMFLGLDLVQLMVTTHDEPTHAAFFSALYQQRLGALRPPILS